MQKETFLSLTQKLPPLGLTGVGAKSRTEALTQPSSPGIWILYQLFHWPTTFTFWPSETQLTVGELLKWKRRTLALLSAQAYWAAEAAPAEAATTVSARAAVRRKVIAKFLSDLGC